MAPSITVRIDLIDGEGPGGPIRHSTNRTLTAPFIGFVDVDYGAAGVALTVGQKYTILLTDISGQAYPHGVSGWVVPAVVDPTPGAGQPVTDASGNVVGYSPFGAYPDGLPVLQGALVANDAGIGDNSFQVLENVAAPVDQTVSGVNAVITAYAARNPGFIVINGGLNLLDHLWTNNLNPTNTTFLGGLTNWYQAGLLVDYTGTVTPQGVLLTHLTVKSAPPALVVSAASLPIGTVGVPYSAPIIIAGGLPPYTCSVEGLPAGLKFDGTNVVGTSTKCAVVALTLTATDALGHIATSSPTLTINPAAAKNTIHEEGQGRISAVRDGYLLVGAKKLFWNSGTTIIVNTPKGVRTAIDSFVRIGMKVQWNGVRDQATGAALVGKLEIN